MKHILTLTDFSIIAENATEAAFIFAHKNAAKLTIYHRLEEGELVSYPINKLGHLSLFSLNQMNLEIPLEKWIKMAAQHNIEVNFLIGSDPFFQVIDKVNDSLAVDMIIMGSTGAGGKKEYLWGSNTEKVVKNVDCPVLVVKDKMKDFKMDNIVFASSFDTREKKVLAFAIDLLNPPKDAVIHLLSINTTSYFSQPTPIIEAAMKDFKDLIDNYKVQTHFYRDYSVDAGIRHFLEEIKPDILIMNNKHENPFKRFIQGSNTIRAVNHSEFPVLTVDYKDDE